MPPEWSVDRLITQRMANQGLSARGDRDAHAVAARTAGLQAQDPAAAHLAVRSRCSGADLRDSVRATEWPATVIRTWLMRGTLHAVAVEDVRWMTALIGPSLVAKFRTHREGHGLTDRLLERAANVLPSVLRGRALTRTELVGALAEEGVLIRMPGQAPAHFTVWASAVGLICRGPDAGRKLTFVLLDDWVPQAPTLDEPVAYVELARRYLRAFGPATVADFATWSGLLISRARRAFTDLADELSTINVADRDQVHLELDGPERGVLRFLAGWDTYLMGYRGRSAFLADGAAAQVIVGGGWLHPSIVLDGRIIGTWRVHRAPEVVAVRASFLDEPPRSVVAQARREAEDIARFYDAPATFDVVASFG